jgi:hypothetical protein
VEIDGFITAEVLRRGGDADENYVSLLEFSRFDLPQDLGV